MIMFVADLFASLGPSSVCFILTFDPSVAFNNHQLLRYQMINSFFHSLSELLISILRITAKPGETKKDIMQHESCAMHLCAPKGSYSAAHAWLMKQPSSLGCVVGCCGKKIISHAECLCCLRSFRGLKSRLNDYLDVCLSKVLNGGASPWPGVQLGFRCCFLLLDHSILRSEKMKKK